MCERLLTAFTGDVSMIRIFDFEAGLPLGMLENQNLCRFVFCLKTKRFVSMDVLDLKQKGGVNVSIGTRSGGFSCSLAVWDHNAGVPHISGKIPRARLAIIRV